MHGTPALRQDSSCLKPIELKELIKENKKPAELKETHVDNMAEVFDNYKSQQSSSYNLPLAVCQGTIPDLEPATKPLVPAKDFFSKHDKIHKSSFMNSLNNIFTLHHSTPSPLADEKATPE